MLAHRAAHDRVADTGAEFVGFRRAHPDMDIAPPGRGMGSAEYLDFG